MLGLGASRFPRVSFKTERPFIIGTVVTFGLITWLHNKIYRDGKTSLELLLVDHLLINDVYVVKPTDPDPFIFKDPHAASETASH